MSIYDKSSLVLIPSGTKTGKVFSQKPVSGDGDFTFTRASAATRVNADGNIEKETQNLLLQSNSFNTTWVNSSSTETSGQSGYDGSSDAWLLTATSTTNAYLAQTKLQSGVQSFSVYAKSGTANFIELIGIGGTNPRAWFNVSSGSVGTFDNGAIDANIESIGSGWYRCTLVLNDVIGQYRIYATDADASPSVTNGATIYIQDAQLNQGLIAQEVITTTTTALYGGITDNTPRLDYTDSSCPALLLEPQRTNQMRYSEYQSGGGFALGSNITWNGFVESPEGVNNASRFTSSTPSASFIQASNIVIPSGDFTYSMWVRGISGSFASRPLYIPSATIGGVYMNETLVAGEDWKLVYGTGNNSGSAITHTITLPFYDQPAGSVFEIYGFQLEAGSYATSYIPTYGSSVSRVADACSKTGVSSLIGQTEGTMYVETTLQNIVDNKTLLRMGQSASFSNSHILQVINQKVYAESYVGGANQAEIFTTAFSDGDKVKIGYAYKANDYVLYVNGVQIGTDTSASVPSSVGTLYVGNIAATEQHPVEQVLLFKTRLSNAELATLTTI